MEWPYEHPRRGDMPPGPSRADAQRIHDPPAAVRRRTEVHEGLLVRAGLGRRRLLEEHRRRRKGASVHGHATTRGSARGCLGGKTNIWGRLALRLSDFDFKAKSHDGYGEDWPISYKDIAPYYDRVDQYLGISGVKENLPQLPDSLFQRPTRLERRGGHAAQLAEEDGPRADAVSRRRHDRRAEAQQVSQPLLRARRVQPARGRMRHPRGVRLPHRPDLPGDGHREPDASNERDRARDPRRSEDRQSPRRRVRRLRDGRRPTRHARSVVIVAASTLESARLLLLSKSHAHPNGIGNSSGHVGHNFCEHVMGPGVTGLVKDRDRQAATRSTTGGPAGSTCRASAISSEQASEASFAATASRAAPGSRMFPGNALDTPGFGAAVQEAVRDYAGAFISMGGFGEVLPRYENQVDARSDVEGQVGHSGRCGSTTSSATTRRRCARTWRDAAQEMFERAGIRDRQRRSDRCSPRAGRSTSSAPREWARTRRRRS